MTITVGGHHLFLPYLAGLGLVVGYIAGLFGIGGGFLLTPMLMSVFGVPAPIAVGSALCQKCGTSISSFLKYRQLGFGEPRVDLVMLGGSLLGVDAGTRLLSYLDGLGSLGTPHGGQLPIVRLVVDLLFIAILTFVAVYTLVEVRKSFQTTTVRGDKTIPGPLARIKIPPYVDLPKVELRISIPVLAYLGFLLGVASGVMGIGGGVLFMPILLYGFGFSARHAAGTGLLLLFATVAVGTFEQGLHGFVDLRLALGILIGSSIGSQLGAFTTARVRNRSLRLAFALLVGATVIFIVQDTLPFFL